MTSSALFSKIVKQPQTHLQLNSKEYASMLNGMTSTQLKQELATLQNLLKSASSLGPFSTPIKLLVAQKMDLLQKEMASRNHGESFMAKVLDGFEDLERILIQSGYANKPTAELQSELAELTAYRQTEQDLAAQLRGMGATVQSQFDSNYDRDSTLEKQIGAIEAELTRRGAPLTAPKPSEPSPLPSICPPMPQTPETSPLPPTSTVGETPPASLYEQQYKNALVQLDNYFDLLDTAAGVGGRDGLVSREDLLAAMNSPGLPAELRSACRFLLENPPAFNQLEIEQNPNVACDGLIGKGDVKAALAKMNQPPGTSPISSPVVTHPPTPGKSFAQQVKDSSNLVLYYYNNILANSFTGDKNKTNYNLFMREIQLTANNRYAPAVLRDACQFFLKNGNPQEVWNKVSNSTGPGMLDNCVNTSELQQIYRYWNERIRGL